MRGAQHHASVYASPVSRSDVERRILATTDVIDSSVLLDRCDDSFAHKSYIGRDLSGDHGDTLVRVDEIVALHSLLVRRALGALDCSTVCYCTSDQ